MENGVKKVKLYQLEPGMILVNDLDVDSKIIMTRNSVLTQRNIEHLIEYLPYNEIEVMEEHKYETKEEIKYKTISVERIKRAKELKEDISKINNRVKNLIKNVITDKNLKMASVEKITKDLINEFKDEDIDIIFKNIMESESVDKYLQKHSVNVAIISSLIGGWMGFSEEELKDLVNGALLHDIGKASLKKDILEKESSLTNEELNYLKTHSQLGYKSIQGKSGVNNNIAYGVLMHHERCDGSGYPLGLKDGQIHPFAKIIAIADIFDAMTSNRCYTERKTLFQALEEIKKYSIKELDHSICSLFINRISNLYTGEYAMLSTGQTCKIIKFNEYDIARPLVQVDEEFVDLSIRRDIEIYDID